MKAIGSFQCCAFVHWSREYPTDFCQKIMCSDEAEKLSFRTTVRWYYNQMAISPEFLEYSIDEAITINGMP